MNPVQGGCEIALTGDIARMVALSLPEGKLSLVAGARNQRELILQVPV